MTKSHAVLLFLFIVASPARAIVCAAAESPTEKTICASEPLMQLDSALNKWFYSVKKSQINPQALQLEQKKWLQQRNQCPDTSCLISSYKNRLAQLQTIERYVDAGTVASTTGNVSLTQTLPWSSSDSAGSLSGSAYSLHAKEWQYKPFYSHNERVKLMQMLKEMNPHVTNDTRIEKIVGSAVANDTVYLYILHYNGVRYDRDPPGKRKDYRSWQLVQISEQGAIHIVDSSSDENSSSKLEDNYRLDTFSTDADGNIYFINNANAQPVLKKWSTAHQQLEIRPEAELVQYQQQYAKKGPWSWEGECAGMTCTSRKGRPHSAHFALHYSKVARKIPADRYAGYDANFADGLFYVQPGGEVETILQENDANRSTWFLFYEPETSDQHHAYFINSHDTAGIWQINRKEKTLTHITALSRIESLSVLRHDQKDYVFFTFIAPGYIYVASEKTP